LASDLFGLDIALGTVSKLERQAAETSEPAVAEMAAAIVAAPSAHIDETSWSEANEKAWLWVGQTDDLTVFTIADNRGADVARSIVGPDKTKVVISDRFPSYDWIGQHRYCWSHLLGDFLAMIDRRDEGSAVGSELLSSRTGCSTGGTNTATGRWPGAHSWATPGRSGGASGRPWAEVRRAPVIDR
jgi:transposase